MANEGDVLVTHAGVIRALLVLVNGLSWPEAFEASVPFLEPVHFPLEPKCWSERRAETIEPWLG